MNNDEIVCRCNLVTVKEIKDFISIYPEINDVHVKNVLNIGKRCGGCKDKNCLYIDRHIDYVLEVLRNE